jgi:hypothetical protein
VLTPRRLREWRAALLAEGRRASILALFVHMAWVAFGLKGVWHWRRRIKDWRRKMRVCYRCPIYNRQTKVCRPPDPEFSDMGCGCYAPFLAFFVDECWGDHNLPGRVGWNADAIKAKAAEGG